TGANPTLNQRWRQLGIDPDTQLFREAEVFAGVRFEAKTGRTLRRPIGTESGDFVDTTGKQWDVKGPIPSAGDVDGLVNKIQQPIAIHPNGDERLIVDVAGLDSHQIGRIRSLLSTYTSAFYELLEG